METGSWSTWSHIWKLPAFEVNIWTTPKMAKYKWATKKGFGWVKKGGEILHSDSYRGIIINHFKDPY